MPDRDDVDEEYEEEEEEEELEEEDGDDEQAMDTKINALEAELKDLRDDDGRGGDANNPNSVVAGLVRNVALDSSDLSPTSQAILQKTHVEDLKRVVSGLQSQLDAAVTAHRNDLHAFRAKEEDLLTRIRNFDDNSRLQKNQLLQIESKYEESITKVALLEAQKNQLETDTREAQRQASLQAQSILGVEDQKKSVEANLFRVQEDLYSVTQECQSLHWKLKTEQSRAEQAANELKESERVIARLQTENQDLGLRVMSTTGTTRIQAAEVESLQRDLKLATAEREESIKVAIQKQQLQEENTSLKVQISDSSREISLLNGSLSNYKQEVERLEGEAKRLQKNADQLKRDLTNFDDERSTLRADNQQLKQLQAGLNSEIDRLNNCLIDERKDRYSNFAGGAAMTGRLGGGQVPGGQGNNNNPYLSRSQQTGFTQYGHDNVNGGGSFMDPSMQSGINAVQRVQGPRFNDSRNAGGIDPLSGPKVGRDHSDTMAVGMSRSKDPNATQNNWSTKYDADYSPAQTRADQPLDHPAGGSSHFISRARSHSPGDQMVGKDSHLGPYGTVYMVDDQWNNAPRGMPNNASVRPAAGFNPRMGQNAQDLESNLMTLNRERSSLEGVLMKYPTNSAGKTIFDRKQKQQAESRLLVVEKEISEIRQALRERKG